MAKTGATHDYVHLGQPCKVCAIKELVVCWMLLNLIPRVLDKKRIYIYIYGSPWLSSVVGPDVKVSWTTYLHISKFLNVLLVYWTILLTKMYNKPGACIGFCIVAVRRGSCVRGINIFFSTCFRDVSYIGTQCFTKYFFVHLLFFKPWDLLQFTVKYCW